MYIDVQSIQKENSLLPVIVVKLDPMLYLWPQFYERSNMPEFSQSTLFCCLALADNN